MASARSKGRLKPTAGGEERLTALLTAFYTQPAQVVRTTRELANRMAGMTGVIRDLILAALQQDEEKAKQLKSAGVRETMPGRGAPSSWLQEWLHAFRDTLIPDLDEHQFADMFAQTLAYGLFAARVQAPNKLFSRESATVNLAGTNPLMRELFEQIAGARMPDTVARAVDAVVKLLKHADMAQILQAFGKCNGREDPVLHFYETFLAGYDPAMREVRGVFCTPEPVVSYIVNSIDWLLKTRLGRHKGLADENTLILDTATGTGTFLCSVIEHIHQGFHKQPGAWDDYVGHHLLPRIFGFELLMAPYATAHLKVSMLLEESGYTFGSDQRFGIYLTNTLEEGANTSEMLLGQFVSREVDTATEIKREQPIMVVLGNPPYANFGRMNRGEWMLNLLKDYKRDLNEKKLNLDDDYIKFIRFAQWRIERTGYGILGYVTNNAYLDGITHRRMRQVLMQTFDEIYVFNLHGSLLKQDKTPEGGKDENVFDITVGVSILLAVKVKQRTDMKAPARVFHADLWGRRAIYEGDQLTGGKYHWLRQNDARTTAWQELRPAEPYFFFVPKETEWQEEYDKAFSLREAFVISGNAIKTERDDLSIHFTDDGIRKVVRDFRELPETDLRVKYDQPTDSRDWQVLKAKADVTVNRDESCFRRILYRPFDVRQTWYSGQSRGFIGTPGFPVMRHLLANNLSLLACRQVIAGGYFHVFCSSIISECCSVSNRSREITSAFPLYLHSSSDDLDATAGRRPNFTVAFLQALAEKLKAPQDGPQGMPEGVTPEDIFHYAYAVFHSPTYRTRYAEFLKTDFPRLPLTSDRGLFFGLTALGGELVGLHLMESPKLNNLVTEFPGKGTDAVEKVRYTDKDGRVWINPTQYFGGVPAAVWNFHIGGYQVSGKWLKDRKGRTLTCEDIQHYQEIVVALNETIRLMAEIDQVIETRGGWPVAFSGNKI